MQSSWGFYRAANSIFGKVGWIASKEVIYYVVKYKWCIYGFEVLNLNKSRSNSLDFVANRFLMKLFNITYMKTMEFCCEQFNFVFPSRQIANWPDTFIRPNADSSRANLLTFVNTVCRSCTPCLKNVPPLTCYNLHTFDPIMIIFGRSVTENVRNQTMRCFVFRPHL